MQFFKELILAVRTLVSYLPGFSRLRPRQTVDIGGMGERLSGKPDVEQTTHTYDESYENQIEPKRPSKLDD